jgi:hypothetical protein
MCHACFAEGVGTGRLTGPAPDRCSVEGCSAWATKAGGMCDAHYRRVLDHGSASKVRQQGPRPERQHPEYKNWSWLRQQEKLCPEWAASFGAFIAAVGTRPTRRHWLERHDETGLFGPGNFFWREPRLAEQHSMTTTEGRRNYEQTLAAEIPGLYVGQALKRYGLTNDNYYEMWSAQDGLCAICRHPETERGKNGAVKLLVVDHDHLRGVVRGLLCSRCNKIVGFSDDSAATLRCAAEYVEKHTLLSSSLPLICEAPRVAAVPAGPDEAPCAECNGAIKGRRSDARFCSKSCAMHWHRREGSESRESRIAAGRICSIAGCCQPAASHDFCAGHAARNLKYGDPLFVPKSEHRRCEVPDCNRPHLARGKCARHYHQHQYQMRVAAAAQTSPQ